MTDETRVMIDIETLGLEPGSAIISIGAVEFGPGKIGETFYREISIESCTDHGLGIDGNTLEWWLDQDQEAQQQLPGGDDFETVLADFCDWMLRATEVWANSPKFDCSHLETAFDRFGIEPPWSFDELRDFRTLRELPVAPEIEQDSTEHDALADAKYQAHVAATALKRLSTHSWDGENND